MELDEPTKRKCPPPVKQRCRIQPRQKPFFRSQLCTTTAKVSIKPSNKAHLPHACPLLSRSSHLLLPLPTPCSIHVWNGTRHASIYSDNLPFAKSLHFGVLVFIHHTVCAGIFLTRLLWASLSQSLQWATCMCFRINYARLRERHRRQVQLVVFCYKRMCFGKTKGRTYML
ncbi:hypothetical protein BKA80DRAFT_278929 [Phyllosticta citrichinensis]